MAVYILEQYQDFGADGANNNNKASHYYSIASFQTLSRTEILSGMFMIMLLAIIVCNRVRQLSYY